MAHRDRLPEALTAMKGNPMVMAPTQIRAIREHKSLEIEWSPEIVNRLPFKYLRGECRCAACVDEMTGVRILDVNTISDQIEPVRMSLTGNYAIKIAWSDGHDTGLYTWETLSELARRFAAQNADK